MQQVYDMIITVLSNLLIVTKITGQTLVKIDTCENFNGAFGVSFGEKELCIATPHVKAGHVQVVWFASEKGKSDFKQVSEKTFEAN